MQSAWRVIDCTNLEGFLGYERGNLVVRKHDEEPKKVPLAETAVLLVGLRASCSTALLHQLAGFGVSVLLCDWRNVPKAALHPWTDTLTQVTARHIAQVSMSAPRKKNAWGRIVKAKIRGQAACLDALGLEGAGSVRALAMSVKSGDPSNVEGRAAREYWKYLFPKTEGFKRQPGFGHGRNAQLDYAYMVLRGFAIKSVISAGLEPTFGVNHHNRSNYFCLADDIIEVFRPAIDSKVALLDYRAPLDDKDVKKYLVGAVNQQFNGSGLTIPSQLDDFSQQFGLYADGSVSSLPVPQFERAA